jgi:hypothetical protein
MAAKTKPQFNRLQHGSLFDRGSADSYYNRQRSPHWWPKGTGRGEKIEKLTAKEVAEYQAGYDENQSTQVRKEY